MKWDDLIKLVGSEPVFASAMLAAEGSSQAAIQLQLSRWVRAGKLIQLRRGLYALSRIHRKIPAHPFIASPEKSLLDLIYLTARSDSWEFLRELRLQNTESQTSRFLTQHLSKVTGKERVLRMQIGEKLSVIG